MTTLEQFAQLAGAEQGLAIVSVLRADETVHSSLVNAGVLAHPQSGQSMPAFVTYGPVKLRNLRARPQLTVAVRSGWKWAAVEGRATIFGPDDPAGGIEGDPLRLLLREVFTAAGGAHDDWAEYDRVMAEQRRAAVFVTPERVYGS